MSSPPETTVIKGSRWKALFYLVVSIPILLMGLFVIMVPGEPLIVLAGWVCALFGGLGVPLFGRMLFCPAILILDEDGFSIDGGLRAPKRTPWSDVEEFLVQDVGNSEMVVYNLAPGIQKTDALAKFFRKYGGGHCFPNGWKISTRRLAEILNAYREQSLLRRPVQMEDAGARSSKKNGMGRSD